MNRAGSRRTNRSALFIAAHLVALVVAREAMAGISFDSGLSTVRFSHDADKSDSSPSAKVYTLTNVPRESNLNAGSFQFNKPIAELSSDSAATGALGYIADSTAASFELLSGTGVAQDDASSVWSGASALRMTVDLYYNVTSGGWGSVASAQGSLAIGGVVGSGGYVQFIPNLRWYEGAGTSNPISSTWNDSETYNSPGAFVDTVSFNAPFTQPSFSNGDVIHLAGYIEFRSSNRESPTSAFPLFFEAGGGAPTGTFFAPQTNEALYSNPANWIGGFVPGLKGELERAKFVNVNADPFSQTPPTRKNITLDADVTLFGLELDGENGFDIFSGRTGSIRFRGSDGKDGVLAEPVLKIKNVQGNAGHVLNTPLILDHTLDLITDSVPPPGAAAPLPGLVLSGPIIGPGGIRKMGRGTARLTTTSSFDGGVEVHEGFLQANGPAVLGDGSVRVIGGVLNYNFTDAALAPITVEPGGQLSFGGQFTTDGKESFKLQPGAILEGSSTVLNNLIGKRLSLPETGGVVLTTTDGGRFGFSTRQFHYGVNGKPEDSDLSLTLGTGKAATWKGLGSSYGNFAVDGSLVLDGAADAFVPAGSKMTLNAPLGPSGGGTANSLLKSGPGTLLLNSTSEAQFNGAITVADGSVIVNGRHNGNIIVQAKGLLGGTGFIGAGTANRTVIQNGGVLAPGNSIGTLFLDRLSLLDGSMLEFELRGDGTGDRVIVTDTNEFSLPSSPGVATINIDDPLFDPVLDEKGQQIFTLVDYAGTTPLSGIGTRLVLGNSPNEEFKFELFDDFPNTQLKLLVTLADAPQWGVNGGGGWGDAKNWIGPVPNGFGDEASFLGKLTNTGTLPAVVEMQGNRSVGVMTFDNDANPNAAGNDYVIKQTDKLDTLLIDNGLSPARVQVLMGGHLIDAPTKFLSNTMIDIAGGTRLRMGGEVDVQDNLTLTKTGAGTLVFQAPLNFSAGAGIVITDGTVDTQTVNFGAVDLQAGTLRSSRLVNSALHVGAGASARILKNGTPSGTSVLTSITIDEGLKQEPLGELDLTDNSLVVKANSKTAGIVFQEVLDLVRSGYANGKWNGDGINSSEAAGDPLGITTLGVRRNIKGLSAAGTPIPLFTQFDGHSVTADDTLVVYTYYGDTDFDKVITADDYARLDRGFLRRLSGWENGDADQNGRIDLDDYILVDAAFLGQNGALAAAAAAPVPEPGVLSLLALSSGCLFSRRRRPNR